MRTAIWGAGSIGLVVGALITKNGGQVDLVDAFQENVDKLNEYGATITGHMDVSVPVRALSPDHVEGVYDLIILLTKQTQNHLVLPQITNHLGPDSLVLTLQNGIPEEDLAAAVGRERVIGGTVGFGATFLLPGITNLTSPARAMKTAFEIGELDGQITPRIQKVQAFLNLCGGTEIHRNLMGARWTKLLINSVMSGMSAALGATYGDILEDETAIRAAAHIADECVRVAKASGVTLVPMIGATFDDFDLTCGGSMLHSLDKLHLIWDIHGALKASMLQDLEKGRRTEIDYINGHVCQAGRKVRIATPFNDMVVRLVKQSEEKGGVKSLEDGSAFSPLFHMSKSTTL